MYGALDTYAPRGNTQLPQLGQVRITKLRIGSEVHVKHALGSCVELHGDVHEDVPVPPLILLPPFGISTPCQCNRFAALVYAKRGSGTEVACKNPTAGPSAANDDVRPPLSFLPPRRALFALDERGAEV